MSANNSGPAAPAEAGEAMDVDPTPPQRPQISTNPQDKPMVVGLYGLPGAGKSHLLNRLRRGLGEEFFEFLEGSALIGNACPGGLEGFKHENERQQDYYRRAAIRSVRKKLIDAGPERAAVVAGHFSFMVSHGVQPVFTRDDCDVYTHIIYLRRSPRLILDRRLQDTQRDRPPITEGTLHDWQRSEIDELRRLCLANGILFTTTSLSDPDGYDWVSKVLHNFATHSVLNNRRDIEDQVESIFRPVAWRAHTAVVVDADKTLAAEDTGALFWKEADKVSDPRNLADIFGSPMLQYSHTAFRQAMLWYEDAVSEARFEQICSDVAARVKMHPELRELLAATTHVGEAYKLSGAKAVVVTSGVRRIWEKVLERHGLSERVQVIGSGRLLGGGHVVTAADKAQVVRYLQGSGFYVWALGDSPLDVDMLVAADRRVVVVGPKSSRSRSMADALREVRSSGSLTIQQVLLPSNAAPPIEPHPGLPEISIDQGLIHEIVRKGSGELRPQRVIPKNRFGRLVSWSRLLTTSMRDAAMKGARLRSAHRDTGKSLAMTVLSVVIGIEEYQIPHVQGHASTGYRFRDVERGCIVALMRGGEPMAAGVGECLQEAMFVHANEPEDVTDKHLRDRSWVVLVDSVVNTGETAAKFVRYIRAIRRDLEIFLVTGVVQKQAPLGGLRRGDVTIVALRESDNQFKGVGGTDTGNRLFNTSQLDS